MKCDTVSGNKYCVKCTDAVFHTPLLLLNFHGPELQMCVYISLTFKDTVTVWSGDPRWKKYTWITADCTHRCNTLHRGRRWRMHFCFFVFVYLYLWCLYGVSRVNIVYLTYVSRSSKSLFLNYSIHYSLLLLLLMQNLIGDLAVQKTKTHINQKELFVPWDISI